MTRRVALAIGVATCAAGFTRGVRAQEPSPAQPAQPAPANQQPRPDYTGIVGGLAFTTTRLSFDSAMARVRNGATIRLGVRLCAFCWANYDRVSLTPALAFAITDVRGMTVGKDPYAFARVDLGAQASLRVWHLRPYGAMWMKNIRTAEIVRDTTTPRFGPPRAQAPDATHAVNFVDRRRGHAWSAGVEIPITPERRGIDISVTRLDGRFDTIEFRKLTHPTDLGYRGWAFALGWSGPFSGASLPWR